MLDGVLYTPLLDIRQKWLNKIIYIKNSFAYIFEKFSFLKKLTKMKG